jgi:dihydroorotate dehydrogenase electron transfer subunit
MDRQVSLVRAEVVENRELVPGVFLLRARGNFSAQPGQFYLVRAWGLDPPLFRPFSAFDLSQEGISFLYAIRGRGTSLLARLQPGHSLTLLGPLGNGWPQPEGKLALVGGGVGIAPLYLAAKAFREADAYLGFPGRPYLVEKFREVAGRVWVASERGQGGHRGSVTEIFTPDGYRVCYACGPREMLARLWEMCRRAGVWLYVSLEERMACGLGACLGCTVFTRSGPQRVCREGPVFPAQEVF